MIVIVNDANILIDLVKLELLPQFFALDLEFYTSSLILEELYPEQIQQLVRYIQGGKLNIIDFTNEELITMAILQNEKPVLSQQDCSAIVSAKKVNGELITSDGNLRKFATHKNIIVRGHLWILNLMVEQNKITGILAIEKLNYLRTVINKRLGLPKNECDLKISSWQKIK